jgi:hypothetical protein
VFLEDWSIDKQWQWAENIHCSLEWRNDIFFHLTLHASSSAVNFFHSDSAPSHLATKIAAITSALLLLLSDDDDDGDNDDADDDEADDEADDGDDDDDDGDDEDNNAGDDDG